MKTDHRHSTADKIRQYRVEENTELLAFLFETLKDHSRSDVKKLLIHRHISLRGKAETRYNTPLLKGDIVEINFTRSYFQFKNPDLKILYEDGWIIVVEKASGLLSVPNPSAASQKRNAWKFVKDYVQRKEPDTGVFVCHRLDQYTSGILLFTKVEGIARQMREHWNEYVKERKYYCVTEVIPEKPKDELRSMLKEDNRFHMYSTDDENDDSAHLAVTRYRTVKTAGRFALLDVDILTGKKNQIRVQLAENGYPIAGDKKYGAETDPAGRLMLHNYKFSFSHPITGKAMSFTVPVPSCFNNLFKERE